MAFEVLDRDHFDGHRRLTTGQATNGEPLLADMFRKFRTAKVVATGAGDEAVAFGTAFDDADYAVSVMFEDSAGGAAAATAYIKEATVAASGFTATVSAAGTYHFIAIHD